MSLPPMCCTTIQMVILALFLLFSCLELGCTNHVLQSPKTAGLIKNVMFFPLDERFTTRDIFLNMAKLTPYKIFTPPMKMICHHKQSADRYQLDEWTNDHIENMDAMVISAEMYLYGGLIASRISNDTTGVIMNRLHQLVQFKKLYPSLKIYLSTVVMRIPAYDGDFEEPWYWNQWGRDMYLYSFYLDRYEKLKDSKDWENVQKYKGLIPQNALQEFLWRRERNFNITKAIIKYQYESGNQLFEQVYITLDDNAPYGLNIKESNILSQMVIDMKLESKFHIYPGADEVTLAILSRLSTDDRLNSPTIRIIYRNPKTRDYIPNYEGQPLNVSVNSQISGCGGLPTTVLQSSNPEIQKDFDYDVLLLVNNWDTSPQKEAPNPQTPTDYSPFEAYVEQAHINKKVIAFADVRYSNGGDQYFVLWLQQKNIDLMRISYAAWNTNGNTLGTVISNAILLYLFSKDTLCATCTGLTDANIQFQLLRFLEDNYYQAFIRTQLMNYVSQVVPNIDQVMNLSGDLTFFEKFVLKGLQNSVITLRQSMKQFEAYSVEQVYFPWNRTFEIGMHINYKQ